MPNKPISKALVKEAADMWKKFDGSRQKAAAALGIPEGTFTHRLKKAKEYGVVDSTRVAHLGRSDEVHFEASELPDDDFTHEELIEHRIKTFEKKNAYYKAVKLITVKVKLDGPIGIAHFGDPHVDDDGCNWPLLKKHCAIINKTEGMFAGNVGDLHNNWIGRLARLYANQSTTAKQAWKLVEWLCHEVPWLYLIGGNHDVWSGNGDPLKYIMRGAPGIHQDWGARLNLQFPNGREVRINARHDFQGHSQWNTVHGAAKAAQMGWRDHILTCGHKHTSGYQVLKCPSTGLISHAIRAASYKFIDSYAAENGLPDQNIFCCPVTIINPAKADDDPNFITTIFDPETAADFLKFLRKRHGR